MLIGDRIHDVVMQLHGRLRDWIAVVASFVLEQIVERIWTASGWSAADLVLQGVAVRRGVPVSSLGFDVGRQAMRQRGDGDAWTTSLGKLEAGPCTVEGRRGAAQTVILWTLLPVATAVGALLGVWGGEPLGAWEGVGSTLVLTTGFGGGAACAALGAAEVIKGRL